MAKLKFAEGTLKSIKLPVFKTPGNQLKSADDWNIYYLCLKENIRCIYQENVPTYVLKEDVIKHFLLRKYYFPVSILPISI